jgi:transcriptional regulator with XRE-family HTH domain
LPFINVRRIAGVGLQTVFLFFLAIVNPRTIQKIEAGGLNILVTTLARLQGALGCEWDALMPKAVVPPSRRK